MQRHRRARIVRDQDGRPGALAEMSATAAPRASRPPATSPNRRFALPPAVRKYDAAGRHTAGADHRPGRKTRSAL